MMLYFTAVAFAQDGQSAVTQNQSLIANFMPLIIIFGIFYFLLIRPQQKRQQEHAQLLKELKKNDEIITASGIHGVISNVKEDTIMVRVDDSVKIEMQKSAVTVVKKKD